MFTYWQLPVKLILWKMSDMNWSTLQGTIKYLTLGKVTSSTQKCRLVWGHGAVPWRENRQLLLCYQGLSWPLKTACVQRSSSSGRSVSKGKTIISQVGDKNSRRRQIHRKVLRQAKIAEILNKRDSCQKEMSSLKVTCSHLKLDSWKTSFLLG